MFSRFGGLGSPGQRITSRQDLATEITITLKHTQWAILAGLVAVTVFKSLLGWWLRQMQLPQWASPAALWVWRYVPAVLYGLAILAPLVAMVSSFIVQIYDINHPPPKTAQAAEDGPNAPGWARKLIGWRDYVDVLEPAPIPYTPPIETRSVRREKSEKLTDEPLPSTDDYRIPGDSEAIIVWDGCGLDDAAIETFITGVLDGAPFSRSYWQEHGLSQNRLRTFFDWMAGRGMAAKNGNNYELTEAGKDHFEKFLRERAARVNPV